MNVEHGLGHDHVARCLADNVESLKDRNTRLNQSTQGSGEAGDGHLADDRTECGHVELELVEVPHALLGLDDELEGGDEDRDAPDHLTRERQASKEPVGEDDGVIPEGLGDLQDEQCEFGHAGVAAEQVCEDQLELRHHHDHEQRHNTHRHNHDRYGIEHGRDDLALDLLGLFHELGQTLEDYLEHTAQFAGFHHVDEETIEDLGVLGQTFREGGTAFDGDGEIAQDFLEDRVAFLLLQHTQTAK